MKNYLLLVIGTSLVCFVARELLSNTPFSSHINYVSGICIFLVALSPIFSSFDKIKELSFDQIYESQENEEKYEEIFEKYIESAQIDMLKGEIRSSVAQKFDLDESEIKVYVKYDAGAKEKLQRVTVSLIGSAAFANSNEIYDYLDSIFDCEIVITVG